MFARLVALIGGAALTVRKMQGVPQVAAWGAAPDDSARRNRKARSRP